MKGEEKQTEFIQLIIETLVFAQMISQQKCLFVILTSAKKSYHALLLELVSLIHLLSECYFFMSDQQYPIQV